MGQQSFRAAKSPRDDTSARRRLHQLRSNNNNDNAADGGDDDGAAGTICGGRGRRGSSFVGAGFGIFCRAARRLLLMGDDNGPTGPRPRNVAVLLFDAVELLDFTGPFQVFADSRDRLTPERRLFNVFTVAEVAGKPLTTEAGQVVLPKHGFEDCPKPDVLVVPGGIGSRTAAFNRSLMAWLKDMADEAELVISVCTGALLLGKAGILDGLCATTYHTFFPLLKKVSPKTRIKLGERWVDNGRVITSAGVSAGIDVALYAVAKLHGSKQANYTAQRMEYTHWDPAWAEELDDDEEDVEVVP